MMSPTLLNVAAIMGLPIDGDEMPFLHDIISDDRGFKVTKKNFAYSTFIASFNKGSSPVEDIEHKAFLLCCICKFFIYMNSVAMVRVFALYVNAIHHRCNLNLGALFLSLLYKSLFTMVTRLEEGEAVKSVFGLLWFLQL